MRKGCCKSAVLSGNYRKPFLCLCSCGLLPRVDNGYCSLVKHVSESLDENGHLPVGVCRVASPYHKVFRVGNVVIPVSPHPFRVICAEVLRLCTEGTVRYIIRRADDLGHGVIDNISHIRIPAAQEEILFRFVVFPQFKYLIRYGI